MIRILITSLALVALVAGCGLFSKKPKASQNALVDVVPPPAPQHGTNTVVTPVAPMAIDAAPMLDGQAPAAGQKYTVKKGDTLWSLAAKTYGNGTQYKKIEAANPSIKNGRILAGQTIVLP